MIKNKIILYKKLMKKREEKRGKILKNNLFIERVFIVLSVYICM